MVSNAHKQPLERLLGSAPKLRILRLLLASPEKAFSVQEIARQANADKKTVRTHIKTFLQMELIIEGNNAKKQKSKSK